MCVCASFLSVCVCLRLSVCLCVRVCVGLCACLFLFGPCVRMFVRSFVRLFVIGFCLAEFPCGNAAACVRRDRTHEKTGGKGKEIGGQIDHHRTAKQRAPRSNRSSDLTARGHRKQDASLGGPKSNPEGHTPARPASKNPAQNHPKRPGCARSREISGRVHS